MPAETWPLVARAVGLTGPPTPAKARTGLVFDDGALRITVTPQHPERELRAAGARFESRTRLLEILADHVVKDGRLVTGQNQNAGERVAEIMMETAGGALRRRGAG